MFDTPIDTPIDTPMTPDQKLHELRIQWTTNPDKRFIIERQAKLIEIAMKKYKGDPFTDLVKKTLI